MADTQQPNNTAGRTVLERLLRVEPPELEALGLSTLYFFLLLGGYYILRPLRDSFATRDLDRIQWLYLGTLVCSLAGSMIFSLLSARIARGRLILLVNRFFAANIILFVVLIQVGPEEPSLLLRRVFFVWVSVYNIFVMSVFWSFMADVWTSAQGKRLFACIAVGGTVGMICGSTAVTHLAGPIGATVLPLLTVLMLEMACWCARRLNRLGNESHVPPADGPSIAELWSGARRVLRSRYLAGIALYMLCYTISSTFLEVTKLAIGESQNLETDALSVFYARIDFWTGIATVFAQIFLTGRLMSRYGVAVTLVVLPVVTLVGFVVLGFSLLASSGSAAAVSVIIAFPAIRRASNFAISKPAREVLYTVLDRRDKYGSKNFNDLVVYRLGDQIGVWSRVGLEHLALPAAVISWAVVPLVGLWFVLGVALGRRQRTLANG